MIITVKYGAKQEAVFNPECWNYTLLESIRDQCKCYDTDIELSDPNGNVKHLRDNPYRYASEALDDREVCVLLKVDCNQEGETSYQPLLDDTDAITDKFLGK
ncbi:DgyrCDS3937 [Dimorphilus gyrociliatus]|uniref:DgyrCDS3937 n=1 Tax=Dimorphilus gyrociliatus TaxID=2664684 RepID=A0A7I8VFY5_9ANNE|nr:DgyrCDS3937 [Dimorphilus gyrociliatus]